MERPTLRHIADQLGVSTATVSLAMRGSSSISEIMKKRVNEALVESGYVYQRGAAGLRTSKNNTVGVIVNNLSDPFFSNLLASLEGELTKAGRTVFLCNSNESVERQTKFIRTMSEYNADGLIISPAIGTTSGHFKTLESVMPSSVVFVSRTIADTKYDSVVNDDYESSFLATRRLVELGHKKISFVGGVPSLSPYVKRIRGYRDVLESASLEFDGNLIRCCPPTRIEGFESAKWIANLRPRPTAAIGYNDSIALGLHSGLQRLGLHPGRNFALIGHENIEESILSNCALSLTEVSRDEMGRLASKVLIDRINNPDAPPKRIVLNTRLIIRDSCTSVVNYAA